MEYLYKVDVFSDNTGRQVAECIVLRSTSKKEALKAVFTGLREDGKLKLSYTFAAHKITISQALTLERCGARIWTTL